MCQLLESYSLFLRRDSQGEESIFEGLRYRTCRFFKQKLLIVVEELDAAAVKEMEKVAQESDAVKDNNLCTHFAIKALSILVHFAVYRFGSDEDVVVNMRTMLAYLFKNKRFGALFPKIFVSLQQTFRLNESKYEK